MPLLSPTAGTSLYLRLSAMLRKWSNTTNLKISGHISGSLINAILPKEGSGIRVGHIPLSVLMRHLSTMEILQTTAQSRNI